MEVAHRLLFAATKPPPFLLLLPHDLALISPPRISNSSPKKIPVLRLTSRRRKLTPEVRASETSLPETEKTAIAIELRREAEEALEWGSVCCQLSSFASTATGRALCRGGWLPIGGDRAESEKLLDQTEAAVLLPRPLDFSGVDDVSGIVGSAVAGQLLTVRELCAVERSLRSARRVFEQLERISEGTNRYIPLLTILRDCDFLTDLAQSITFCIDCTLSIVMDRASKRLESIRMERRGNMERLESLLKEVSLKVFQAGGIDRPLVTKRRARMCVGVKASHKFLIPEGIVLSSSSSGATYFMEPKGAIELNNMEIKLLSDEKSEELVVLGFLSSMIASSETKIKHLMEKIMGLDLACARGTYARGMEAVRPFFGDTNEKSISDTRTNGLYVDIEGIHHPLLLEPLLRRLCPEEVAETANSKMKFSFSETPVPLDFKIGHSAKVIVISGPNTGGKTATMKTLGLASLMSKAGMFLPAKGRPRLPWFDQVLADIGDHQSLEHSLSTFSGHISRICKMIEVVSNQSLVLIDEIGSGTDPSEGVALSTSILQYLVSHVNLAVVTTHYADLSRLKAVDSRFENAAMEFCMETLRPTYHILWGSTGNSNALSIAKSIGFDQKVLDRAQEWVEKLLPDKQKERLGLLYQSLLEERNLLESRAKEAASVLSEVKQLYEEIHSEAVDLDRREAILKARESQKVQQQLKALKSQMDSIIRNSESRLLNSSPDRFNLIMREAEASIASLVVSHQQADSMFDEETKKESSYVPRIGDEVYVNGLGGKLASVVEVPGEDGITVVRYGKIKVRVKKNDLKLVRGNMKDIASTPSSRIIRQERRQSLKGLSVEAKNDDTTSFAPAVRTSKNTVDLRGMRVEEASHHLQMAISGSRSHGILFVVHGMGTGAVKDCTLDVLGNHPRVIKFEEESPVNYGCTVAYIK